MRECDFARARWRCILGDDYIGQQSFVASAEVACALSYLDPERATIADLGCGRGAILLDQLRRTCWMGLGVDPDEQCVQEANAAAEAQNLGARARFVVGDSSSLHMHCTRSLDCVISLDALQYAPNLVGAIRDLRGALAPSGEVYATVWCMHADLGPLAQDWGFPAPITSYQLEEAFRVAGMDIALARATPRFEERVRGSLAGLLDLRDPFVARWGGEAFGARLRLERATLDAVKQGQMQQVEIRAQRVERPE